MARGLNKVSEAKWEDDQLVRLSIATLFGALVEAIDKSNPGVGENFRAILKGHYYRWRDESSYPAELLETIKWAADSSAPRE